ADLARGLAARGHEVVVYAARGSEIDGVVIAALDVDPAPLRADFFRAGAEAPPSGAMTETYRRLYAHLRRERFDVVHNHGFDVPAVSAAADARVAVLHTLHLPPTTTMTNAINESRRSSAALWCAAVSRAHAAAWGRVIRVDQVLRNGVPVDEIPFVAQASRCAVVAARFSAEKGVDEGIAAARLAGWPVTVYGTPYDPVYEAAVRSRWSGDRGVSFRAPVPRASLWRAFGAAGAILCLSRWEEPYGMVAAEAQAAGTPVVASRLGGLCEVVGDGTTGYLVPAARVDEAASALVRTVALDRQDCRRRAVDSLGLDQSITDHEAAYARYARRARQ
ncbi:MAG: glycosyltransferase, partial [Candidatus Dormibacteraeota bacterium]|nr:glycosyltransferase [Candidatus Dormibacteraeota bacterium]